MVRAFLLHAFGQLPPCRAIYSQYVCAPLSFEGTVDFESLAKGQGEVPRKFGAIGFDLGDFRINIV